MGEKAGNEAVEITVGVPSWKFGVLPKHNVIQ